MNQLRAHLQQVKENLAAKGNRLAMRPPRSKKAESRQQGKNWNEGFAAIN
jgi:hypothetical protein